MCRVFAQQVTYTHSHTHVHMHTSQHTHSLPITVYWNITQGNQSMQIIENPVEHSFQSDFNLTLPSDQMMMTFSETGQFAFVALFQNDISSKSGIFWYTVTSGMCVVQ